MAFRKKILDQAVQDKEFGPKLERATSMREIMDVMLEFCKARNIGVVDVETGRKV